MPKLTILVDEETLRLARKRAARMNRSLPALVRDHLRKLAAEADVDRAAAAAELVRAMEAANIVVGPKRWTRDKLHARTL